MYSKDQNARPCPGSEGKTRISTNFSLEMFNNYLSLLSISFFFIFSLLGTVENFSKIQIFHCKRLIPIYIYILSAIQAHKSISICVKTETSIHQSPSMSSTGKCSTHLDNIKIRHTTQSYEKYVINNRAWSHKTSTNDDDDDDVASPREIILTVYHVHKTQHLHKCANHRFVFLCSFYSPIRLLLHSPYLSSGFGWCTPHGRPAK